MQQKQVHAQHNNSRILWKMAEITRQNDKTGLGNKTAGSCEYVRTTKYVKTNRQNFKKQTASRNK